jgi:predicted amidohydrolase YtcJ
LAAQALCLQAGLTGVHDASLGRGDIAAFRELDREGKLKVRVYGMASTGARPEAVSQRPEPAKPTDRFVLRAIKIFIDGAMGSRGGLLFEPYSDDPGNSGLLLTDPESLEATTETALRNGWQVCTHAIGDKGNDLVLSAYEAALRAVPEAKDPRLRIEHAQVVRRSDIARFRKWNIVASMQPSHSSDDMRWADARLGPDRVQGAYAWRWFLDGGVRVAFGSDFPVEIVNPFWGIYAAITRQDEKGYPEGGWHSDQRLSLDETLRAFTAESAYAAFEENRLGVLKPGMRADVIIVDRDLDRVPPIGVLKAKVLATMIDGEVVYEQSAH